MSQPVLEITASGQLELEVEEAVALCGGDVRSALRATLIANAYLQREVDRLEAAVSAGFGRRKLRRQSSAGEGTKMVG
jgi:hypothetical protein